MADTNSTVQFKADISQLKAAMQAAQRQVRLASSEFKVATAGLDNWSDSAEGLQAKIKQLNTTLAAQKKQAELAKQEWEKTAKVYGENSAEADRAKIALNNYEAAVKRTESQLDTYESELKDCENGTGRFADSLDDLEDAAQKASDGFTVMKGALANLVADGIRVAISAAKDLAKQTLEAGMNFESAMSQVEAISGATADEMEALSAKAKEMGEKTKFSATESAEAFNYMAMAGWKTEDMINGIEGIMNLAAASGEDLATTSDIVTDALTAMGYSAGDAGRLADVMAAASSNANTNVAMMGQTFQYAAPIVGALGMNMEDTAVAIGLMANAGIKGEKAGTALRSILTRLSAPPKECADAMEKLGISLTDSEGNMKSLDDVMKDLRKSFDGLSETEQTSYAKAIAGQEAMSGLLAVVNAAPADFEKLTKAVEGSNGAAEDMAETMQDNLGGQITLLKSKVEGIMIKVFEKASGSIKGAIDEISNVLDEIDWDSVADAIGRLAQKAVDFFKWLIKNGDVIIETFKSIAKVALTVWAVNKVNTYAKAINGAITAIKAFAVAMKAGETATTAASAAGGIFANLISPGGAIVLGIAAVIAVTATLISLFHEEKESIKLLTEEQEASIQKSREMGAAYRELESSRKESMNNVRQEFGYYQELVDELDSIVDANGKVKEGYEDRAGFITTTLNEALGMEIKMTDGVIENYQKEREEINKLMETKKAQAMLNANEGAYTEALQKRTEATKTYADAQNTLNELQDEFNAISGEYETTFKDLDSLMASGPDAAKALIEANQELYDTYWGLKNEIGGARGALKEAEDAYVGYNQVIKNYEGLSAAIISGDSAKIKTALADLEYGFITAENGTRDSLERQRRTLQSNYESLQEAIRNNTPGITQEMVNQAKYMVGKAVDELDEFESKAAASAEGGFASYVHYAEMYAPKAKTAAAGVKDSALEGLKDNGKSKESGEDFGDGYVNGISGKKKAVTNATAILAEAAEDSLNDAQESHSPSKVSTTSGEYFGQGYANGIENKESTVWQRAFNLAKKAIAALKEGQQEGSPSKLTYQSGVYFTQGYINGIASMTKGVTKAVKGMVTTATKEAMNLDNFNFSEVATNVTSGFSSSLSSKMSYMLNKIQYQNEQKLKDFDKTISALQKKLSGTKDENLKKQYQAQIDEQNKIKTAYQTASQRMISEFTSAMNSYQTQAQNLINSTINGITTKYNAQYTALVSKQNNLINKLKSAGDLFEVSGAGIMTVNDIKAQTKQIKEYAAKLQKIKGKVSADLFDEIASYDMDQGGAFMDRLLALSDADLKAYSNAYDEKMSVAEKLADKTYKKDFAQVAKDYKAEVKKAFKDLPKQLEAIGTDTMKGFVKGLTTNTDYMDSQIKTFVKGMVNTFKKQLKIKSPSRVMMEIGDFTGAGFVEGLKDTIGSAKKAATELAKSVSTPFDTAATSFDGIRAAVAGPNGNGIASTQTVTNNYNLVQNNNSPKALSALETYRARRQQIAMVKALT